MIQTKTKEMKMKKTSKEKFPVMRQFDDYHEIMRLNDTLKGTGIKAFEVSFDYDNYNLSPYWALLYTGTLADEENKKCLKDFKEKHKVKYVADPRYTEKLHTI